jgi:FkbM family methyltransferase
MLEPVVEVMPYTIGERARNRGNWFPAEKGNWSSCVDIPGNRSGKREVQVMEFVSYAQNLEDVMLYRALKYVEHGCYIDVGAWHPVIDSVTKAFYDRGWRGINIEPEREYFDLLEQDRPEDVNLNVAVGAYQGEMVFYEVAGTGLSTADRASADLAVGAGRSARQITMPCTTLAAVCREHEVGVVHFLKIDVEGTEKAVLEGCDFGAVRPWIIVVEANEPNSTRDVSEAWEHLIVSHDYDFVYYDGLNRFYLAAERPEIRQTFTAPPNVFDSYVLYAQIHSQEELAEAQALQVEELQQSLEAQVLRVAESRKSLEVQVLRVAELEDLRQEQLHEIQALQELRNTLQRTLAERNAAFDDLEQALAGERGRRELLAAQLQEVYNSRAWRVTAPFRAAKDGVIRGIRRLLRVLMRHERLRRLGGRLLAGRPGLKSWLRRLGGIGDAGSIGVYLTEPQPDFGVAENLSEPARAIYFVLRDLHDDVCDKEAVSGCARSESGR